MTNPTNWPNPERPGVPMFPERDGWHWIYYCGTPRPLFWGANTKAWFPSSGNRSRREANNKNWVYGSPIPTPTRIAELLAGERERCAKECDEKVAFANHELKASASHEETRYWIGEHCAATFCADAIRGLGDKA